MDIILHDYYNLGTSHDINFYWMDKNRTFILKEKDYKKEGNNAVHSLNGAFDGSYSITLKKIKDIEFSIRVNNEILYNEKSNKIYFKIETKPQIKFSKLDKQHFIKNEYTLKKGVSKSSRKSWNLYWNSLHWLSFNYPEIPNENDKKQIANLTEKMIDNGLACPRCKMHFKLWNKKHPVIESYNSKENLIKWYIDLHNDVNMRNNKGIFTIEQIKDIYKDFDYNELINRYKIDIILLFKKRELVKFPDIINNTTKKILWKENNIFQNS